MRLLLLLFLALLALPAAAADRPNIIFIMSDDHTTQAVGAYGSRLAPLNPTPTIDKHSSNAYADPAYAAIIKGLKAELKTQREQLNETDKTYPHIQKIIDAHWN